MGRKRRPDAATGQPDPIVADGADFTRSFCGSDVTVDGVPMRLLARDMRDMNRYPADLTDASAREETPGTLFDGDGIRASSAVTLILCV